MNKIERFFTKYFSNNKPAKVVNIDVEKLPYIEVELNDWTRIKVHTWQFVIKTVGSYVLLNLSFSYYSIDYPISKEDFEYSK